MKLPVLGWCALVFALTGAIGADAPPTIDDVKAAWKERQEANKTFRIEWVETVKVKAGAHSNFLAPDQPPGPHPPEDTEFTVARSFAADGEKIAGTVEGQLYLTAKKAWGPYMHAGRFDGRTAFELDSLQRPGWGLVLIRSGKGPLYEAGLGSFENLPVKQLYRPLGGGVFDALDFKNVTLSGRTEKIGGAACAEVVIKDAVSESTTALWCDPDRGYLPVRESYRYTDGSGLDFEWEYRPDDKSRWVPTGWEMKWVESDGSVQRRGKAQIKKLELAPKLAAETFAPNPPPACHVLVTVDGALKDEYLVRPDGSKRPLKASERDADFDEVSKTNADRTPYVPAKK